MNIWIKFLFMHIVALYFIAVITGNYAYLTQNFVAIQPLVTTVFLANVLNRLTIIQLREDNRDGEGEALSCIFYALAPALFYNALVYVFYRNENIWVKMFFLWFVAFGFFGFLALTPEKRDDFIVTDDGVIRNRYLTQNLLEILLYFFVLISFAIAFQYVALRIFQKGSLGEAWSLAISSLCPPVLFYLIVKGMKCEEQS
jgi:hypothetical protein